MAFFFKKQMDKRNRIQLDKSFLTKLVLFLLCLILLFFLGYCTINRQVRKLSLEKQMAKYQQFNEKTIFSIDKILIYSSAFAENTNTNTTAEWKLNVHQYADIALYLNNHAGKGFTPENTVKQLSISHIRYLGPTQGTPLLGYKNPMSFGKYETISSPSEEIIYDCTVQSNTLDLTQPTFLRNCSMPITLSFVNSNIKTDYILSDISEQLTFNGKLLKRANILLSSIHCTLSFTINLTNNQNEKFSTTVRIPIPIEESSSNASLYDGNIFKILEQENLYTFFRYE